MKTDFIYKVVEPKDFTTELEIKLDIKTNVIDVKEVLEKIQANIYSAFELTETEVFPTLTIKKINGKEVKNND